MARLGNWRWDIATGEISWSDETFRLYGYEPGAFTPTPDKLVEVAEVVHPDDRDSFREAVGGALNWNEPYDHNYRVVYIQTARSASSTTERGSSSMTRATRYR